MADNVLTEDERKFLEENAEEIRTFANSTFAGHVSIMKRAMYETIALKLGKKSTTCWTCGGSVKRIGQRLEKWL